MPGHKAVESRYPIVEIVLRAVANWINKHHGMNCVRDELEQCSPEDAMRMANDLGVSVGDLRSLAAKRDGAVSALPKMMSALSVDAQALMDGDPAVMRDLQRTCILCDHKSRCEREIDEGGAWQHFREFCPNAYTFDALFKQKVQPPRI